MFAGCEKLIVRASWSEEPAVETQYWWRFTKYAHLVISYLLSCFLSGGQLLLCVHTGIDPGRQRKMRRKQKATRKTFRVVLFDLMPLTMKKFRENPVY